MQLIARVLDEQGQTMDVTVGWSSDDVTLWKPRLTRQSSRERASMARPSHSARSRRSSTPASIISASLPPRSPGTLAQRNPERHKVAHRHRVEWLRLAEQPPRQHAHACPQNCTVQA